jgi:PHP domain-containing protein
MLKKQLQIIDNFKISPEERLEAARYLAANFAPDMDAVCEIDLHCHSFYSDGYYSPANKVFEAYRRKMKAIAISDHDVFDGQDEAIAAGEIFDIEVIPAIEFYTNRPGVEIIAHFPDKKAFIELLRNSGTESGFLTLHSESKHETNPESPSPTDIIEPIRTAKKKQLNLMLARIPECFKKLDFSAEITQDDIDRYLRNGISTKGDISVAMWQKYGCELHKSGLSSDVKDFQAKYTTQDKMLNMPLEIDMDLSPEAFIKRVLGWGGIPGLSHPTELRKKEGLGNCELRKLIANLAAHGLQTIEVDGWRNVTCPEAGMNQTDLFEEMRQEYNLKLEAGNSGIQKNKTKCPYTLTDSQTHSLTDSRTHSLTDSPSLPLLFTNGSDDHNQPGEGLELGCGRNHNLRPEFGKYENIKTLKKRVKDLTCLRERL